MRRTGPVVSSRRRVWLAIGLVLLLGWTVGLAGWWLTATSSGSGAVPSASVALSPQERSAYSAGGGPAPSTVGILTTSLGRCTATMVSSTSRSLAVTAAHCVYSGGRWLDDGPMEFYPGYSEGDRRFGVWSVEASWVPAAWQNGAGTVAPGREIRSEHDIAFLRLRPDAEGNLAQDVLGAQGFTFEAPVDRPVTVTGYPAEPPYDGETQESCGGVARDHTSTEGRLVGLTCALNGGSSGSAWMTDLDADGLGYIAAVQSGIDGAHAYGPPFGPEAEQLYETADRGTT